MKHAHYNNNNGSLYQLAEQLDLNAWEFDILKRICRCRKKGQFAEDLQKIIDTIELYKKEYTKKIKMKELLNEEAQLLEIQKRATVALLQLIGNESLRADRKTKKIVKHFLKIRKQIDKILAREHKNK